MWNDKVQDRYWWHPIKGSMEEFLYELAKAEDEEEVGFYLLNLYLRGESDFKCFARSEEKKIKKILTLLINDTLKHRALLSEIVSEIGNLRHDSVQDPT